VREEARDDRDREAKRRLREPLPQAIRREHRGSSVDQQRTDRHPEHRHGDRDEGEVVVHRDAEDPGQQELIGERRERDQEQAGESAVAGATG
jgi:hypothetical protein